MLSKPYFQHVKVNRRPQLIPAPTASAKSDFTSSASQSIVASPPSSPSSNCSVRISVYYMDSSKTTLLYDIEEEELRLSSQARARVADLSNCEANSKYVVDIFGQTHRAVSGEIFDCMKLWPINCCWKICSSFREMHGECDDYIF
ncbi:hypothetical protein L1987_78932 [Smallanthus sonchifolius]|uniref:Uncharacterized protein n=1 Tax=Smallanthus sonchifolius TaxID=185202 RepID=A0ACB8ZDR8_9ASTR|nr:hypothetical protein L1987_78932 [Smallanthus sonchifolius]